MKKHKVLIVGNEIGIYHVLERMLTENNYEVVYLSDEKKTLSKIHAEKPDLIIVDIAMHKSYNGGIFHALQGKKALAEHIDEISKIPIIILSAKMELNLKDVTMKREVKGYILKSFELSQLVETIGKCVV
ncbi:MAG: response regulator [Endomicrobiales bacterium]|nr:response regulator [Endomicrobiales bacterium]